MRAIAASSLSHARLELRSPGQWARAITLAVAWPLGQYVGGPQGRAPGRLARAPSTGHRLMRILVVSHGFPPHAQGGAEIYAHEHALAFARARATRCWC